ncbi:MAG: hypothetical protein B7Z80_01035 [Rhodospirillales bacterium 20-64-7]|nr:MAG: hypothetical protein B7Z80_01035 [Rhodospirillales bacterium 20-64-7]
MTRPRRPLSRLGAAAVALLLLGATGASAAPGPATASALVKTEPVHDGAIENTVTAYGRIEPAPSGATTLSLPLPGIVDSVEVAAGATVRKGEVIARIGADPATRAAYKQAKSALHAARSQRDQVKDLLRNHLATRAQLGKATEGVVKARTALEALTREGAGKAVRVVTAPFDATVTAVQAVQGAQLATAAPLVTLVRASSLIVSAGLDPDKLGRVQLGDIAKVTLRPGDPVRSGKVIRLGGVANPRSGLVDVQVSLPAGQYLIGQVVSAEIVTATVQGVVVPRDAALTKGKQHVLYQVANGHARAVQVKILASRHGKSVVSGKIDRSLPIVIQGNYQLKPGMAVRTNAKS